MLCCNAYIHTNVGLPQVPGRWSFIYFHNDGGGEQSKDEGGCWPFFLCLGRRPHAVSQHATPPLLASLAVCSFVPFLFFFPPTDRPTSSPDDTGRAGRAGVSLAVDHDVGGAVYHDGFPYHLPLPRAGAYDPRGAGSRKARGYDCA